MSKNQVFDNKHKDKKGPDAAGKAVEEFLHESIVIIGFGICSFSRLFLRHPLIVTSMIIGLYYGCVRVVSNQLHIEAIHSFEPTFLTIKRVSGWVNYFSTSTLLMAFQNYQKIA